MTIPLLLQQGGQCTVIGRMEEVGKRVVLSGANDPADPMLRAYAVRVESVEHDEVIKLALRQSFTYLGGSVGDRRSHVLQVEFRQSVWLVGVYSEVITD